MAAFFFSKLYFPQQARTLLGVWTHNSHLLPPNYSACVTGYTNKNIAHILTFEMVRSEVSSMISTNIVNVHKPDTTRLNP